MSLNFQIHCTYRQFFVRDKSVLNFAFRWTDVNGEQGFARQDSAVSFASILDGCKANVRIVFGPIDSINEYHRVISVPLKVSSGQVLVEGPEDALFTEPVLIPKGFYKLTAAQRVINSNFPEEEIDIDLYFESTELLGTSSEVLLADSELSPPSTLKEYTELFD